MTGRVCELFNGTVITPGTLGPWLTEADVERVVFDGPSRVIDVGVRSRNFGGATHVHRPRPPPLRGPALHLAGL